MSIATRTHRQLGDKVRWSSQAGGHKKTKEGTVAQIVPHGKRPDLNRFPDLYRGSGCGIGRKELSYVVRVGNKHYWPVASKLERV